jgi:hypothetical protein
MLDSEDVSEERFSEMQKLRDQAIEVYRESPNLFDKTPYAPLPERQYGQLRQQQVSYFADVLSNSPDVDWVFLRMHKPLWDSSTNGFMELEKHLESRGYTILNGHEHAYHYTKKQGVDYINFEQPTVL